MQPSRQAGTRMHAGATDGSAERPRRVVFGVPTVLHVLTEPGAEIVGAVQVLAQVACICMNCGKWISTVCVLHQPELLLGSEIWFPEGISTFLNMDVV